MFPYIPITDTDKEKMLTEIGENSIEGLFKDIPDSIKLKGILDLDDPKSEMQLVDEITALAGKNMGTDRLICFLGAGAYDHYIPSAVNHLISRSEFYTAYTPYQPEVSQGTLQAIFEYQTMICSLTGMDAANASIYDGATALAEAVLMAAAVTRRTEVVISNTVHPEYREVLKTYLRYSGIRIIERGFINGVTHKPDFMSSISGNTACTVMQNPNFFGSIEEIEEIADYTHKKGGLMIVCVDPISLGLLKSPGEMGADVVVGEGQPLGNPMCFGGPYLGIFAVKEKYIRRIPGRIAGETVDREGKTAYVLTLQAREQHIRREKATSNICSNQALNVLAACIYMAVMGKQGIRAVADLCLQKSHYACSQISCLPGYETGFTSPFFKEFVIKTDKNIDKMNGILFENGILGGYKLESTYDSLKNHIMFSVTEKRTRDEIDRLVNILEGI